MSAVLDLVSEINSYLKDGLEMSDIYTGQRAPQDSSGAYVVMWIVLGDRDYTHIGASALIDITLQIEVYDEKWADTMSLAGSIENLLSGFSGSMGDEIISNIRLVSDDGDLYEKDKKLYSVVHQYEIQFYQ